MSRGRMLVPLLLLIMVQALLLGVIIFDHHNVRKEGVQTLVAVDVQHPVTEGSSTSLNFNCKGLYVQTLTLEEKMKVGARVFVTYREQEDGTIQLEKYYFSRQQVPEGQSYLEAQVGSIETVTTDDPSKWSTGGKSSQYLVHMYFNFSRMYLAPVMQERLIQQLSQPHESIQLQVTVWQGKSILNGIYIDGQWTEAN